MDYKKELKEVMDIAKKIVNKSTLKKANKIDDLEWRIETLKYAIRNSLKKMYEGLAKKAKKVEFAKKDTFFVETKLSHLRTRIRLFEITFHKKDFEGLLKYTREVEKEIKNVAV
ncbi:hypothetical protein GOV14_01800 [Candidatus Pacearchaeota archaeon]|nr:hypothetical protein [Candidatus Pacearchaeota archaeon]